jgi:hypothetical protein
VIAVIAVIDVIGAIAVIAVIDVIGAIACLTLFIHYNHTFSKPLLLFT